MGSSDITILYGELRQFQPNSQRKSTYLRQLSFSEFKKNGVQIKCIPPYFSAMKRGIAILGSTGSIGTQALEVIASHPDHFTVEVLTAQNNADLLIAQSIEFNPNSVVIVDNSQYQKVKSALDPLNIKVFTGSDALSQVVEMDGIDVVLTALVGFAGLQPTVKAILAKKQIALANKETLVVAGEYVTQLARENGVNLYPVDSEHSAIFQCLAGEWHNPIVIIVSVQLKHP